MESNGFCPLLNGIVVLELADSPVAYCGRLLASLGADVWLVEPPTGAERRRWPPFKGGRPHQEGSLSFAYFHGGKRGITLDLACESGRELFRRALQAVDVVLEGGPPGRLREWGLNPERLLEINPRLVGASITPFGQDGPYRDFRAPDAVAFAMGGVMYISGSPGEPPVVAPGEQGQMVAGTHAAYLVLVALWERERSGQGQWIDVSIQEALAAQENLITSFLGEGKPVSRVGSQHRVAAPGRVYPCRDGWVHLFISPVQSGAWDRLLDWMGHPLALAAPEWQDARYRRAHVEELDEILRGWTRQFTKQELYYEAQRRKIPCAPVNTMADFVTDVHMQARGFFQQADHAYLGTFTYPASVFAVTSHHWSRSLSRPAPLLGEHTDEWCRGLGLSPSEIEALYVHGVV